MNEHPSTDQLLLDRLQEAIEDNLQNEQFGVPELADAAGLSKSQLNRKLQSLTTQSASQFIREYRLKKAMELLQSKAATPTEVSYKVGFGSPSYFSTCFKEFYGYSPGEVSTRAIEHKKPGNKISGKLVWGPLTILILIVISYVLYQQLNKVEKPVEPEQMVVDRSIAIIPFVNLSNREEDLYLTDGVMNAIHQHLSRIGDLNLRSTTSTSTYRNSLKNIEQIGQELEVAYILEGNFQKVGEAASLLVKLIFCRTDSVVWTGEYNEAWSDIFLVQNKVATKVAKELKVILNEETIKGLDVIPTDNMVAYELYLKGNEVFWSWWEDRDKTKLDGSAEYYRKAIAIDGQFSYAYTGLVRTLFALHNATANKSERTRLKAECRKYIQKAIDIDPYNGWAHAEKGTIVHRWDKDTTAARTNFDIALQLEPNNYEAYNSYYQFELYLGNCAKLEQLLSEMTKINPKYRQPAHYYKLRLLECHGNYSEIAALADAYGYEGPLYLTMGRLHFYGYLYSRKFVKANQIIMDLKQLSEEKGNPLCYEGLLRAMEGNRRAALAIADSVKQLASEERISDLRIARIYAALGDKDQMYKHMEIAVSRGEELRSFSRNPEIIPYRNEARFQEIVQKSTMR
jgi:TolB-like protein/AraC-like DNA-binding protein